MCECLDVTMSIYKFVYCTMANKNMNKFKWGKENDGQNGLKPSSCHLVNVWKEGNTFSWCHFMVTTNNGNNNGNKLKLNEWS